MPAAVPIIGGAIAAGGSIIGASQQSKAAKAAANTQAEATRASLDLQERIYDQNRSDLAPFRVAGTAATNQLLRRLGFVEAEAGEGPDPGFAPKNAADVPSSGNNFFGFGSLDAAHEAGVFTGADYQRQNIGETQWSYDAAADQSRMPAFSPSEDLLQPISVSREELEADPSYRFRLDESLNALTGRQRAGGITLSGNALQDLTDYASNYASQEYGNVFARKASNALRRYGIESDVYNSTIARESDAWNRLANLAGAGQQSVSTGVGAGQGYANAASNLIAAGGSNQGNALLARGAAAAGGFTGASNAINGGINNALLYNYLGQNNGGGGLSFPSGGGSTPFAPPTASFSAAPSFGATAGTAFPSFL